MKCEPVVHLYHQLKHVCIIYYTYIQYHRWYHRIHVVHVCMNVHVVHTCTHHEASHGTHVHIHECVLLLLHDIPYNMYLCSSQYHTNTTPPPRSPRPPRPTTTIKLSPWVRLHFYQCHFKDQYGVWINKLAPCFITVAQFTRQIQFNLGSFLHQLQPFRPSFHDFVDKK